MDTGGVRWWVSTKGSRGVDCAVGCRLAVRGAFVGASLLFLLVNVLCAVLSRRRRAQPWALLLVRVLVSDSLFVICALSLAACLCLVARRAPSTSIYLEAKVGSPRLVPGVLWGLWALVFGVEGKLEPPLPEGPLLSSAPGDQCVPGSCDGWCHGPAVCQSSLLQSGGPGLGSPEPAGCL